MLYNVAQLFKEGIGASRQRELTGELVQIDENNPGPIAVAGTVLLVRTPRGILATGQVHLRLVQTCRRCLETTEAEVEIAFEEEFVPSIDFETGAKLPVNEDEPELIIDEHHILDLTEVLRQYAVMSASDAVLCRPDCRGLCPQCGQNLNLGPCACATTHVDPRLASLAQLLGTMDD
jgi:uncharacterized protein